MGKFSAGMSDAVTALKAAVTALKTKLDAAGVDAEVSAAADDVDAAADDVRDLAETAPAAPSTASGDAPVDPASPVAVDPAAANMTPEQVQRQQDAARSQVLAAAAGIPAPSGGNAQTVPAHPADVAAAQQAGVDTTPTQAGTPAV